MTVSLIVHYTTPDDAAEFERHYLDVHAPLVEKVPGVQSWSSARVVAAADGGDTPVYRIATLLFADQEALQTALATPEGQATAADYQQIAPAGSRMFIAAVD
jgi:uncharacterized protein (TIGR02118 family)